MADEPPCCPGCGAVSTLVRGEWETVHDDECDWFHDEWVNPKTGHGADCGCISCHMSQVQ